MMKTSFEKRIKRQVTGHVQTFFAIVSPGIETVCETELRNLETALQDITREKGGIEFKGRIHQCFRANLHLRTASRILMRIEAFKVTNFRQLLKKMAAFPWELYLRSHHPPEVNITSKHSRLFHKEAIKETILAGIEKRWGERGEETPADLALFSPQVFARIVDDLLTVSIDSSGEILYKRGIKTLKGKAPLRETIAAAALKIAGYDGTLPLIDPMCGAGTFSIEGAMIRKNLPPGWFRDFAFMAWPCFQPGRWTHEKREAGKQVRPSGKPLVFASDKDEIACAQLKESLAPFELMDELDITCRDFFSFVPSQVTDQKGFVVLNPPYGIRIGTEKESNELFDEIIKKLLKDYKGFRAVIIASGINRGKKIPFAEIRNPFSHGGLTLDMIIGRIK